MGDPLADNPMVMEMVNQLTPFNYMFFFQQFPDIVPEEDWDTLKKSGIGISRNIVFSIILGVFANVQIKRIPKINFLTWKKPIRMAVRPVVFVTPFFLFLKGNTDKCIDRMVDLHEKYYSVYISRTSRICAIRFQS